MTNIMYAGTFKWYKVYVEEEPDIEKPNPNVALAKILYEEFEKEAKNSLFPDMV